MSHQPNATGEKYVFLLTKSINRGLFLSRDGFCSLIDAAVPMITITTTLTTKSELIGLNSSQFLAPFLRRGKRKYRQLTRLIKFSKLSPQLLQKILFAVDLPMSLKTIFK